MTHKDIIARATEYFEGTLSASEIQEIETHLEDCKNCRAHFEHMREMIAALGKLPESSALSPEAKEKLTQAFRESQPQRKLRPALLALALAAVVILVAILWTIKMRTGGSTHDSGYAEFSLDLSKSFVFRGETTPQPGPPFQLPRARLNFLIHLPAPGNYEVVLQKEDKTYAAGGGSARLEDHSPILRVRLDLSQVPSGEYLLGIRPAGWDWKYYRAVLK